MARSLSTAVLLSLVAFCFISLVGCADGTSTPVAETSTEDDHDHGDHDHDHGDHDHSHDGHDHPEHGPNGGHMANLTGGAHAEWAHDDDKELLTVYPENPAAVTAVMMRTTIEGTAKDYEFAKADDDGVTVYTLTSPELLTAIKMGDAVKTELIIQTADGEASGKVVHHAH